MEMTSKNHLWALCAISPLAAKSAHGQRTSLTLDLANIFFIRPCDSSLLSSRCTSVLWVPGRSLTASVRELHPYDNLSRMKADDKKSTQLEPSMHIQIL